MASFRMNGLRRTLSFRKKKKKTESTYGSKPQQWLDDEVKIKDGCCSFQVKYLGNIEVYESRGMQVCEEAIKALRKSKKKPQKAILYVSGDALRVSDDVSQHLIVDQTIEKVSFCAPDRGHEKGFAYICRDGATRRWMCHAFLAVKESGERLSHAVGCAFAICLEKKQKRERDALQLASSPDDRTFVRVGSFRPATLAERLIDPQSTVVTEHQGMTSISGDNRSVADAGSSSTVFCSPSSPTKLAGAIPRPRPSPSIIERQGSMRLFPKLQAASPFKRDLSLRLEELPSNLQRLARITNGDKIPEETGFELDAEKLNSKRNSVDTIQPANSVNIPPRLASPPKVSHNPPFTSEAPTEPQTVNAAPPSVVFTSSPVAPSPPQPITSLISEFNSTSSQSAFISDPFSAAPFDPSTIQQYQFRNQMNSISGQPVSTTCFSQLSVHTMYTAPSVLSTAPTSPFLGGPPIVAPMSTAVVTCSPWSNRTTLPSTTCAQQQALDYNARSAYTSPVSQLSPTATFLPQALPAALLNSVAPGKSMAYLPYTGASQVTTASWLTHNDPPNWRAPVPPLLPPEPDRFADPFDVGWADRATASFASEAVGRKPGNPFLTTTDASTVNGNSNCPMVPSRLFLP